MKTVVRYEIREYQHDGAGFSKALSNKLRGRASATKLVKRLVKMGHKHAFAAKLVINV